MIPLADTLGVTVTELLTGERTEQAAIPPEAVEAIVKTAISYTEAAPARAWQGNHFWHTIFVCACSVEALCLFLLYQQSRLTEALITSAVIATLFGFYFCFFAQLELPSYYDQNKISGVNDGPFRMNVPGLHFNNNNWPKVVQAGRLALLVNMVGFPLLSLVLGQLFPELWFASERIVLLFMLPGGIFIPIYIVGKKYE